MKIRDKLLIGFTTLIAVSVVLGVVSFTQLSNLGTEYTDLANVDSIAMEIMMDLKYDVDYALREMWEYIGGDASHQRDEIITAAEEFDHHVEELKILLPEYLTEIEELAEDHDMIIDLIVNSSDGVLADQDMILEHISEIFAIHEEIDDDIGILMGMIDDPLMELNASIMNMHIAEQMLFVYEYIANQDPETRIEFNASLGAFDTCVSNIETFYAGNTTVLNQLDLLELKHDNFSFLAMETGDGVFDDYDRMQSKIDNVNVLFEELVGDLGAIDLQVDAHIEQNKANTQAAISTSYIIIIVVIIVAVILGVAISFPIIRGITRAISDLVHTSGLIAEGDLTKQIKIKGNDEITKLNRSFETMVINLRNIISSSQGASVSVANIATELAASSSEVNAASEEISSTTEEVAVTIQTQVQSLNDISTMANEIESLARNVKDSGDDIKKVMEIIIGISEQTNLLALNASIEAGRAGEFGRGFAVVADEVRKLAEESKLSVESSSSKIQEILSRIERTVDLIGNITHDIQGSLAGLEETSSAMEGISSSTEQQTASMEEVTSTANRLGSLAEELKSELDMFVISKETVVGEEIPRKVVKTIEKKKILVEN